MRLAILDSGISMIQQLKEYHNVVIKGFYCKKNKGKVEVINDYFEDNIGHGTAITYQIVKEIENVTELIEIYCYKIIDNFSDELDEEILWEAIKDAVYEKEVDIINISAGTIAQPVEDKLRNLCANARKEGTIIVAAFDNEGRISYPAYFEDVLGVDTAVQCLKNKDIIFNENSPVNLLAHGVGLRLPNHLGIFQRMSGSSFATPNVVVNVLNLVLKNGLKRNSQRFSKVIEYIKRDSKKINCFKKGIQENLPFKISKAIIVFTNKEQKVIFRYADFLNFEIAEVYDYKYSGSVGKSIPELVNSKKYKELIVKNIKSIDWEADFDTVILGHSRLIDGALSIDSKKEIIQFATRYNKNVYSYDEIPIFKNNCIFFPSNTKSEFPEENINKLYAISTPVCAIMGTSPKQGKMSIQIKVKKGLENSGYTCGFLSSEPNGYLLGAQQLATFGFDSTNEVTCEEFTSILNKKLSLIEKQKHPDIIICGSQSQSVAYSFGNLGFYPFYQYSFLLGIEPDAIILAVNIEDELDYILRTIKFIESSVFTSVIAICVFPFLHDADGEIINKSVDLESLAVFKKNVVEKTKLPVLNVLTDSSDEQKLLETVIQYFS